MSNKKRSSAPKKASKRSTKRQKSHKKEERDENEKTDSAHLNPGMTATQATVDDNGGGGGGGTEREVRKEQAMNASMEKFCQTTVAKKIEGLKAEFATLASYIPAEPAAIHFQQGGKEKNRYGNIPCYDKTRVVLNFQVPPESDYIHANYVDSQLVKLTNRYICAQAPMNTTLNDWWRLIWQEKPKNIIMLCRLIENGKPKCADYFPSAVGEQKQFGNIFVQYVRAQNNGGEKAYESILLRAIVGIDQFALTLHKWFDWPDFGVPPSGMGLLRLLRVIRIDPGSTAVIHCSAGVGRTGTVMAIELALRSILDGKEVNILEIVKEIRNYRACSVQTEGQYVFIHRCLIEYVKAKKLAKAEVLEFANQYTNYKKATEIQNPQTAPMQILKPPEAK